MTKHSIVSKKDARADPYPYVYVNDDGTVRELTAKERQFLEEPFLPGDGGRPYVKPSFSSRTPDGRLGGFLRRSRLP